MALAQPFHNGTFQPDKQRRRNLKKMGESLSDNTDICPCAEMIVTLAPGQFRHCILAFLAASFPSPHITQERKSFRWQITLPGKKASV